MAGLSTYFKVGKLSFWQRLKILFGSRIGVRLVVATEHDPGEITDSESEVWVGDPDLIDKQLEILRGHPMKRKQDGG